MSRLESTHNQKLDSCLAQLRDGLVDISSSLQSTRTRQECAEWELLVSTRTDSIIQATETLLVLVAQVKQAIVLGDLTKRHAMEQERRRILDQREQELLSELNGLTKDMQGFIA
jgi:predicted Fe-S protein YdhL (DUF1289 family)